MFPTVRANWLIGFYLRKSTVANESNVKSSENQSNKQTNKQTSNQKLHQPI